MTDRPNSLSGRGFRTAVSRRVFLAGLLGVAACTSDDGTRSAVRPAAGDAVPSGVSSPADSAAGLGPMNAALTPSATPVQAGSALAGSPLPTNQWWTSALTGPWTQAMWVMPVVAQATAKGLGLAAPADVTVTKDHVTADPTPQLWLGGPLSGVQVTGYGDFSVTLSLQRSGAGAISALLAQGSPLVHLTAPAGELSLSVTAGTMAVQADSSLTVTTPGRIWQLITAGPISWQIDGTAATATLSKTTTVVVAARPDNAAAAYDTALATAAGSTVTGTTSTLTVDRTAKLVRQHLAWTGTGTGIVATMPHQRLGGAPSPPTIGTFETALGRLHVVAGSSIDVVAPLLDPSPAVPTLRLDASTTATLQAELTADLANSPRGAGIYDDAKALGRLAILADIAHQLPDQATARGALAQLSTAVTDWLTGTGSSGSRWLAYEPSWGGIVANPPQFGNQDYNDHHFHYGYLIRAAATLQRLSGGHGLTADQSRVVDLMVDDVLGGIVLGDADPRTGSFPPFRVWNAYLGHAGASGFAPFADGNNQESSSEAVQAWEAITSWGRIRPSSTLVDAGTARYSMEALAARTYWLGETVSRPAGYDHDTVGIVWGGKIDFATFFDAEPEAVIGIELLPFTPASTYRSNAHWAARRVAAAKAAGGGTPRLWPDLFVMEEAIADPAAALAQIDGVTSIEAGNSRTWMRWWTLSHRT